MILPVCIPDSQHNVHTKQHISCICNCSSATRGYTRDVLPAWGFSPCSPSQPNLQCLKPQLTTRDAGGTGGCSDGRLDSKFAICRNTFTVAATYCAHAGARVTCQQASGVLTTGSFAQKLQHCWKRAAHKQSLQKKETASFCPQPACSCLFMRSACSALGFLYPLPQAPVHSDALGSERRWLFYTHVTGQERRVREVVAVNPTQCDRVSQSSHIQFQSGATVASEEQSAANEHTRGAGFGGPGHMNRKVLYFSTQNAKENCTREFGSAPLQRPMPPPDPLNPHRLT